MAKKLAYVHYGNLAVAALFFGVSLCLFSVYKIVISSGAAEWRATRGTVVKSEVVKTTGHPSQPHVVYEYEVGGERFTSDEIAFLNITGGSLADETAARYPRGKVVAVYYDPSNPARSVLEPKLSVVAYLILTAGALCLGVWRWSSQKSRKPKCKAGVDAPVA